MEEISEENTEAQLSEDEIYPKDKTFPPRPHSSRRPRPGGYSKASSFKLPKPSVNLPHEQLLEMYSYLYSQTNELLSHKSSLEESLRAEMLSNEEQRSFIEVLKHTIHERLDQMELQGVTVDDITNFRQVSKSQLEQKLQERINS